MRSNTLTCKLLDHQVRIGGVTCHPGIAQSGHTGSCESLWSRKMLSKDQGRGPIGVFEYLSQFRKQFIVDSNELVFSLRHLMAPFITMANDAFEHRCCVRRRKSSPRELRFVRNLYAFFERI